MGRHDSGNRGAELTFEHVEGSANHRSKRELQRNHNPTAFERAHDPTESAQRDWTTRIDVRVPGAVERAEHFFQNRAYVSVGPRLRLTSNGGNQLRRGVIVATQPDLDGEFHSG